MLETTYVFFVTVKAWAVFALMFGPPVCLLFLPLATGGTSVVIVAIVAAAFYASVLILWWQYSVGRQASIVLGIQAGRAFRIFKGSIFYLFFVMGLVFLVLVFPQLTSSQILSTMLFGVYLIGLGCIYYLIVYLTSVLTKIDNERTSLSDYVKVFFAIMLLPIGIWFIQPLVNRWSNRVS